MTVKAIQYSSYDFAKEHDEDYFELLRLARISVNDDGIDLAATTALLNQLPVFEKTHKRIISLLNDKAHKLAIFDELSAESKKILTTVTQQGIVTELARKQQLTKIITTLSGHNIPLVLLKGAAFADVLYSAQAPRTSNDLDILIHKKHWHKAVSAIKTVMDYTEKLQPDVFGDLYELSFIPKGRMGAALDLHSSLIHPLLFKISEEQLWDSSVEHPSYSNKLVRVLSPEHALIHQALHAYSDMDFSKYNLVDSHEIIMAQKPDIKKAILIAKKWGASTPLFALLKNCSEIMGTDISNESNIENPADLLKEIAPNPILYKVMVKLVKSRFTQPKGGKKPFRYRINQILAQFIYTGSFLRPLALQWLYVKSLLNKTTIKIFGNYQ